MNFLASFFNKKSFLGGNKGFFNKIALLFVAIGIMFIGDFNFFDDTFEWLSCVGFLVTFILSIGIMVIVFKSNINNNLCKQKIVIFCSSIIGILFSLISNWLEFTFGFYINFLFVGINIILSFLIISSFYMMSFYIKTKPSQKFQTPLYFVFLALLLGDVNKMLGALELFEILPYWIVITIGYALTLIASPFIGLEDNKEKLEEETYQKANYNSNSFLVLSLALLFIVGVYYIDSSGYANALFELLNIDFNDFDLLQYKNYLVIYSGIKIGITCISYCISSFLFDRFNSNKIMIALLSAGLVGLITLAIAQTNAMLFCVFCALIMFIFSLLVFIIFRLLISNMDFVTYRKEFVQTLGLFFVLVGPNLFSPLVLNITSITIFGIVSYFLAVIIYVLFLFMNRKKNIYSHRSNNKKLLIDEDDYNDTDDDY